MEKKNLKKSNPQPRNLPAVVLPAVHPAVVLNTAVLLPTVAVHPGGEVRVILKQPAPGGAPHGVDPLPVAAGVVVKLDLLVDVVNPLSDAKVGPALKDTVPLAVVGRLVRSHHIAGVVYPGTVVLLIVRERLRGVDEEVLLVIAVIDVTLAATQDGDLPPEEVDLLVDGHLHLFHIGQNLIGGGGLDLILVIEEVKDRPRKDVVIRTEKKNRISRSHSRS
jgi:hypothetical protein